MSTPDSSVCECGCVQQWAADPTIPVEYDPNLSEFYIDGSDGIRHLLRYCFRCGGKLPGSAGTDLDVPRPDLCKCGRLQQWGADPSIPVEYDPVLSEFYIDGSDGYRHLLQYCFSCGGRLPESTRSNLEVPPDEAEIDAAFEFLSEIKSVSDVVALLGEPDRTFSGEGLQFPPRYGIAPFVRQLIYSNRWKSCELVVTELPDGSIKYFLSAKLRPDVKLSEALRRPS